MASKKKLPKLPSRTNPIARAAILSKGGAHQKTRSAQRQAEKQQLRKLISRGDESDSSFIQAA